MGPLRNQRSFFTPTSTSQSTSQGIPNLEREEKHSYKERYPYREPVPSSPIYSTTTVRTQFHHLKEEEKQQFINIVKEQIELHRNTMSSFHLIIPFIKDFLREGETFFRKHFFVRKLHRPDGVLYTDLTLRTPELTEENIEDYGKMISILMKGSPSDSTIIINMQRIYDCALDRDLEKLNESFRRAFHWKDINWLAAHVTIDPLKLRTKIVNQNLQQIMFDYFVQSIENGKSWGLNFNIGSLNPHIIETLKLAVMVAVNERREEIK